MAISLLLLYLLKYAPEETKKQQNIIVKDTVIDSTYFMSDVIDPNYYYYRAIEWLQIDNINTVQEAIRCLTHALLLSEPKNEKKVKQLDT